MIQHSQSLEKSAEILRIAVPRMTALSIPITPENYAVLYEYYTESNLNLTRAIDGLIANNVFFSASVNTGLYNRFIEERTPEVIENVQIETQILIKSLFNKVEEISQGTGAFGENLSQFGEQLQQSKSAEELNRIVLNIASEVEQVLVDNNRMKQDLVTLGNELSSLKADMDNLSKVAMTDELTSLNNRRAYESFAYNQLKLFEDNQVECCLMLIDIDHFKKFNDTYGHLIGDKVLSYVALALKNAVKGDDFVARYGGEEFIIMLPNTQLDDAVSIAEKIRQRIAEKQLTIGKEVKQSLGLITVSIGIAAFRTGDDIDTLLARADEQMYLAKSSGRNCVKFLK
ncbi:GGDEF domain-containing protein [Shewanella aestuarii]|uniref:diguanylate cyclase n=1 Tax=Shewanella aestuarii TaxID=1028752 RepID=A0A6G9QJ78_9GAMM|nr:GGDEF domain-containing protein [Shewanella aestuarii]QIR14614.1 GGDEF domain-containing protein [Shewanella aestuarii]